jgi:hypothetical protein
MVHNQTKKTNNVTPAGRRKYMLESLYHVSRPLAGVWGVRHRNVGLAKGMYKHKGVSQQNMLERHTQTIQKQYDPTQAVTTETQGSKPNYGIETIWFTTKTN